MGVVVIGTEVRGDEGLFLVLAPGEQEDGRIVGKGLGRSGEGILATGALLHREDSEALAVGDAAEPVGDGHADALLSANNRADAGLCRGVDHRLGRVYREELGSLPLEDLCDCVCSLHIRLRSCRLLTARCGEFTLTLALSHDGRGDKSAEGCWNFIPRLSFPAGFA